MSVLPQSRRGRRDSLKAPWRAPNDEARALLDEDPGRHPSDLTQHSRALDLNTKAEVKLGIGPLGLASVTGEPARFRSAVRQDRD